VSTTLGLQCFGIDRFGGRQPCDMRPPANRIATISGSTDRQEGAQLARGGVDAAPRKIQEAEVARKDHRQDCAKVTAVALRPQLSLAGLAGGVDRKPRVRSKYCTLLI